MQRVGNCRYRCVVDHSDLNESRKSSSCTFIWMLRLMLAMVSDRESQRDCQAYVSISASFKLPPLVKECVMMDGYH